MVGGDSGGEGLTFRVNFSNEGGALLRDRVEEKLKEYMGDYTDDTLVEYVIVLLKNGRRKDEARDELNVFLDDNSDSFVSWLWDHLGSNLNLYVQVPEAHPEEVAKTKPTKAEQVGRSDLHQLESESDKANPNKSSRSRHNRDWKGPVRDSLEHPRLQSSVNESTHTDKEDCHRIGRDKRSASPQPVIQRKRSRVEERTHNKREVVSQVTADAPRRLLQFAVRDAVAASMPPNLTTEPSLKRLRSVVSTSNVDSSIERRPKRLQSVARVPNAMATAIKAVAEAAKDVRKFRSSGNVFDRLGRAGDISNALKQSPEYGDEDMDGGEDGTYSNLRELAKSTYDERDDYSRLYIRNMSTLQSGARMAIDRAPRDEDYDVDELRQDVIDAPQTVISGNYEGEDSVVIRARVADRACEIVHKQWMDQDQTGNLNTWRLPQYQETRASLELDNQKPKQVIEQVGAKSGMLAMKENNNPVSAANGNAKPELVDLLKESQKDQSALGLNLIGQPAEDADSRTIFVNNVHFATTRDSLLRHFNKFGEVMKVFILTDAATGQPKGSAYVEFTRKEAAESALSVDGTSFMSRILRVVRKSSAQTEASAVMSWPRIARSSPFAVPRFGRVGFPRGISGAYRSRLPFKPGARSFQWKRDSQSTPAEMHSVASSNINPSSIPRSLTYVRTESKTNRSTGET